MKNYVQAGVNLTLNAPYGVSSGDGALIGSIFGVAASDADNGAECDFVTEGVFTLPKESTDDIAIGAPVYWDDTAKVITVDSAAGVNYFVGVAVTAAGNPSASVNVRLAGMAGGVIAANEAAIAAL